MKYHITADGPKVCNASIKSCKYGEAHFDKLQEAEKAFAETLGAASLKGVKSNRDGELSAETSRAYGHWAILNDHLHNAGNLGDDAEILYYSTAQGRLELARRKRISGGYREYEIIEEKVNNLTPNFFSYALDEELVRELVAEGEKRIPKDSKFLYEEVDPSPKDIDPLRHYLVERSHEWMQKLTPEEQEAVSWLTSNGFGLMQHSFGFPNNHAGSYFKGLVDEQKIWDKHPHDFDAAEAEVEAEKKRIADEYREIVMKALSKAPKLDEPVVIARGTSLEEVKEIIGYAKDSKDYKTLMDQIEAGLYNGKTADENSRIAKIPQSAAVRAKTVYNFANQLWDREATEDREVVLAIKGRTFASPVNVGAWGTGEYEVYTNPLSTYKITGGRRVRDDLFILELEEE